MFVEHEVRSSSRSVIRIVLIHSEHTETLKFLQFVGGHHTSVTGTGGRSGVRVEGDGISGNLSGLRGQSLFVGTCSEQHGCGCEE